MKQKAENRKQKVEGRNQKNNFNLKKLSKKLTL